MGLNFAFQSRRKLAFRKVTLGTPVAFQRAEHLARRVAEIAPDVAAAAPLRIGFSRLRGWILLLTGLSVDFRRLIVPDHDEVLLEVFDDIQVCERHGPRQVRAHSSKAIDLANRGEY